MNETVIRRKPRDTSKKRNSILDAAIKAFELYGYYDSTMEQIAKIAEASKRTLYNHFPNKEMLLDAVIYRYLYNQDRMTDFTFDLNRSLYDQLSDIANSEIYLIETEENKALSKVLTSVCLVDNDFAIKTRQKYSMRRNSIYHWFETAQKEKFINVNNVEEEVNIFITLIQGYITWPALFSQISKHELMSKKRTIINRYISTIT